jgi:DNA repair protein RecN (Recombination protein N)
MLQELHVTNFALIDHLDLSLGPGLNALTGETGAGKSIIIDALGLALGERATGGDVVRTGADRALVEAVFDISDAAGEVKEKLAELGLESDDDLLMVTREIARSGGKSQCRINGRLMPVSVLKEIGDHLVDVHGQHDHQQLLSADRHIDILDAWGGKTLLTLRSDAAEAYGSLSGLRRELEQLQSDARDRMRLLDLYRFQAEEITNAALRPGEEEELAADRMRLANAEKLATSATEAFALLSGEDRTGAALDRLGDALTAIDHAAALDENLAAIASLLRDALSYAEDASRQLRLYRDGVEFNPERLDEIESRLELIRVLKRKYGETIEEILAYREEICANLDRLENSEQREADLTAAIAAAEGEAKTLAARLTEARRRTGRQFAESIAGELADLGMNATQFEVSIEPHALTARGADKVEFLLSANPGEPLRPLARVASGGEMSRIMLAMKSVMARSGEMPTMVFDEIDVGVGGRTGQVLADKLGNLGSDAQILCITHLPQIAARAQTHFFIEKRVVDGRTIVEVRNLTHDQRVEELARMLGGTRRTDAVVQHAREMLGQT